MNNTEIISEKDLHLKLKNIEKCMPQMCYGRRLTMYYLLFIERNSIFYYKAQTHLDVRFLIIGDIIIKKILKRK